MDDEIDVVVTGHTNWAVNCVIDGKIVTGAASNGRLITDIDLTVSRATKDVVGATVNNRIVTRTVEKAPVSPRSSRSTRFSPHRSRIASSAASPPTSRGRTTSPASPLSAT